MKKRGYHDLCSKFLSHDTEKFCWGTIQCIKKFRLSRKFFAWEGDITILCRKFLFHSTEKLRRRHFLCFKKILVSKIFMHRRGGGIMVLSKFFCITGPKNFVGEPFSVSLISGIEKFYAYEGNITTFYRKFVVSQYRKTLWGNPSVFHKISGIEKFMDRRE